MGRAPVSYGEAAAIADEQIAAIVDREIARMRSRGLSSLAASRRLRCQNSWVACRASMVARLRGEPRPRRGRPAMRAGSAQ